MTSMPFRANSKLIVTIALSWPSQIGTTVRIRGVLRTKRGDDFNVFRESLVIAESRGKTRPPPAWEQTFPEASSPSPPWEERAGERRPFRYIGATHSRKTLRKNSLAFWRQFRNL